MIDPLAEGILIVGIAKGFQSFLFLIGGIIMFFGLFFGMFTTNKKNKTIGMNIMFLGAGLGAYPTFNILESIVGVPIFNLLGYDVKILLSALMMFGPGSLLFYRVYRSKSESVKT